MRKRIIPLVLSASMLFSFAAYAAESVETESSEAKSITFRGFDWLTPRSEVEATLADYNIFDTYILFDRNKVKWLEGDYEFAGSSRNDHSRIEDGGWRARYKNMTAGGYAPSKSEVYYVYPVSDGALHKDEGDELLYLGIYTYEHDDFEDLDAVFEDLASKLTSLYGVPLNRSEESYARSIWTDADGNNAILVLYHSDIYPKVSLAYEYGLADERLQEIQDIIDRDAAASQESERKANASNTDGL